MEGDSFHCKFLLKGLRFVNQSTREAFAGLGVCNSIRMQLLRLPRLLALQ
jgi:hypothetical protein